MSILDSCLFKKPIAYRGLHNAEYPENSTGAFENAIKHGFPIKLDVQCINDGPVVVFRDSKLRRMTGKDGYVSTLEKSQLKDTRLGETEYCIPTLEEVLELVNGKVPILVEIESEDKIGRLEKRAEEILKAYGGDFAVQSFNPYSLGYFKQNAPHVMRGQLSTVFTKKEVPSFFKRRALTRMSLNNISQPDFISYNAEFLPNKYVSKIGLPTLAQPVRSQSQADKLSEYCDNIIFEKFIPDCAK